MRGFAVGSFTLIVAYVLLQPGKNKQPSPADRVGQGGGLLVYGLQRAMSGNVAGVPQRKTK